ncbi:MAG: hypothetical protein AAFR98_03790 [Pseudomonadota bacterium]
MPRPATYLALGGLAYAAACTPTPSSGPNSGLMSAVDAGSYFNDVCGETAPTFSAFFGKVTNGAYVRNPSTDAYEHTRFDLSFQLSETRTSETCTMRFRSSEDPIAVALFVSGSLVASGPMNLDQETGFATREIAPNVIMTFEPKIDGDTQHLARLEVGVR